MFNRLISGDLPKIVVQSESDFYRLWGCNNLYHLVPVDMAIKASAITTNLEWVFVSGYQATLNYLFPEKDFRGWSAFLFAENCEEFPNLSPTSLVETGSGLVLSGSKSWVAQSRFVQRLVVSVKPEKTFSAEVGGVVIDRHTEGVTITSREPARFLKKMSQGWAVFDNVVLEYNRTFERPLIRKFGKFESHFMVLSILSFLISYLVMSPNNLLEKLISLCEEYVKVLAKLDGDLKRLDQLRPVVRDCIEEFLLQNEDYSSKWEKDKNLLFMYL